MNWPTVWPWSREIAELRAELAAERDERRRAVGTIVGASHEQIRRERELRQQIADLREKIEARDKPTERAVPLPRQRRYVLTGAPWEREVNWGAMGVEAVPKGGRE